MEGNHWVKQIRKLLERAKPEHFALLANFREIKTKATRRKLLILSIKVNSKHYALQDEIQLFVLKLGRETLISLTTDELEDINAWLDRTIESINISPC